MWSKSLLVLLSLLLLCGAEVPTSSSNSPNDRSLLHFKTCPRSCNDAGAESSAGWSSYHNLESLSTCPEPILLMYNLYTPFGNPDTHISIRACTLGDASTETNFLAEAGYVPPDAKGESNFGPDTISRRALNDTIGRGSNTTATCGAGHPRESEVTARLASWTGADLKALAINGNVDPGSAVTVAIDSLARHVQRQEESCDKTILFSYVRGTLVGLYAGTLIDKRKTPTSMLQRLAGEMKGSSSGREAIEVCGEDRSASTTFGVVADTSGDFAAVQEIMKSWNEAECISTTATSDSSSVKVVTGVKIWSFDAAAPSSGVLTSRLGKRAECRSIRVEQGEDCPKLATRCGIGGIAFENFNRATPNFCSTLRAGQPVCCSSGDLPDVKPKPDEDGTCATYDVQADEGCDVVAAKHGLRNSDLDDFNKKTWGWDGCGNLMLNQRICVSVGDPPMPAEVWDAICGPTVPGTAPPEDGEELADLNPCPVSVCCNIWGKCGTTSDFCTISNTTTGNPGTSKPGENGCVSNCGSEIINNDTPPELFRKIGYFEAWNFDRPCLNMHVLDIDSSYTHVHFAFAEISADHQVVIPDNQQEQWRAFTTARNFPAKILAFGGWAFSNEGPGAHLLREVIQPATRERFAQRVVDFAVDNQLAGLDFDWEYPGATDIEGSPPGQEEDGENYYEFLKLVRDKLPEDKSLSIAAPASYWYLRGFPIKDMAEVLDYLVYMTYDFHGQWDVGNQWAQPGCPSGTCLRSHINSTTTHDALVMITKAGVPSHKVVVGVSSYGRSFKMADSTCRGPQCTYLGERNQSPAKKGRCTGTGGYISDFEINEIIDRGGAVKTWYDSGTDTDYLVYDAVEWVAYMSTLTKQRRMRNYKNLNFGGTSDWAVDLQGEGSGEGSGRPIYLDPEVYENGEGAHCTPPCILVFPPSSLPEPTTIRPGTYVSSLEYGAMGTTTIGGTRTTTAFITRTTTITITIPPITVTSMSYSNVNITEGQENTDLWITPSIQIGPVSVPVPDGEGGTTTRTLILPPWPDITNWPASGTNGPVRPPGPGPSGNHTPWDPPDLDLTTIPPGPEPTFPSDDDELPVWTTWPPDVIHPIEEDITETRGTKTPCNLWFFSICISWGDNRIGGLDWILPPGIYPPGPPPPNIIRFPPEWTIKPPLPPWPPITVGFDNQITYSEEPPCETESAELCMTTTFLTPTVLPGPSTSTITSETTDCETIYGCSVTDWETAITTSTGLCPLPTPPSKKRDTLDEDEPKLEARQFVPPPSNCAAPAIVYPLNASNVGEVPSILARYDVEYKVVESKTINFVAFYYVPMLSREAMDALNDSPDVEDAYYYQEFNHKTGNFEWGHVDGDEAEPPLAARDIDDEGHLDNKTTGSLLQKRDGVTIPTKMFHLSHDSHPPGGEGWRFAGDSTTPNERYRFSYDDAAGEGQYVYIIFDQGYWDTHPELTGIPGGIELIHPEDMVQAFPNFENYWRLRNHGTAVAGMVAGKSTGVCKKCGLVFVTSQVPPRNFIMQYLFPRDMVLQQLIHALDHIITNGRQGRAVINMSFRILSYKLRPAMKRRWFQLFERLEREAQVALVAGSGNDGGPVTGYPALFAEPGNGFGHLANLMVVGATTDLGFAWEKSQTSPYMTTYAPGHRVIVLCSPNFKGGYNLESGTSFATPQVAGVVAYFRSMPSLWTYSLTSPANVKKLVMLLHRPLTIADVPTSGTGPRMLWNGQVGSNSCVRNYAFADQWEGGEACPSIEGPLDDVPTEPCGGNSSPGRKRQNGGSCPLPPGSNGPGGGGSSVPWSEGPDGPKCESGTCGGELCRGFYCDPNPTGLPPDFRDPKDPNRENGGGGGGDGGGPGDDGLYTGPGCSTYTSMTLCDSGGGGCTSGSFCVPTRLPCPGIPIVGRPQCPDDFPLCGSTTYVDLCARTPAAAIEARETVAMPEPTTPPILPSGRLRRYVQKPEQQQQEEEGESDEEVESELAEEDESKQLKPEEELAVEEELGARGAVAINDVSINNSTGAMAHAALLGARQDGDIPWGCGGHNTGGCTRYLQCAEGFCYRVERISCVQGYMYTNVGPVDTNLRLEVQEDGELMCSWSVDCKTIDSPGCITDQMKEGHDCGGGNSIEWNSGLDNFDYISSKTDDRHYTLWFSQLGDDNRYKCYVLDFIPALCIDAEWVAGQDEC